MTVAGRQAQSRRGGKAEDVATPDVVDDDVCATLS